MADVSLRAATTDDLEYIVDLLAANDLPIADVPDHRGDYWMFEIDGETVGTGALVRYQTDALLRSVVIEAEVRGRGYGRTCCRRLLETGVADEIEAIYLLTTTAEAFFADLGFEPVDREAVPEPIRETRLFADFCPTSATAMQYGVRAPTDHRDEGTET